MSKEGTRGGEREGSAGVRGRLRRLDIVQVPVVRLKLHVSLPSCWSCTSGRNVQLARTLWCFRDGLAAGLLVHEWHVLLLHHLPTRPCQRVELLLEPGVLHTGQGLEEGSRGRGVVKTRALGLKLEARTGSVDLKIWCNCNNGIRN